MQTLICNRSHEFMFLAGAAATLAHAACLPPCEIAPDCFGEPQNRLCKDVGCEPDSNVYTHEYIHTHRHTNAYTDTYVQTYCVCACVCGCVGVCARACENAMHCYAGWGQCRSVSA